MFYFYTTTGTFENGTSTLKTHQVFSVHTIPEEFEDTTIIIMCLGKTQAEKSHHFHYVIVSKKLHFLSVWTVGLTLKIELRVFKISAA